MLELFLSWMVPRSLSLSLSLFTSLLLPAIHPSIHACLQYAYSPVAARQIPRRKYVARNFRRRLWKLKCQSVPGSDVTHSLTHSPLRISRSLMRKDGSRDCAWKCISVCAGHPLYRVVQLNSTPEIKVSYMLFERPLSIFTMTLVCKRNSIFLFRPNTNIRLAENLNIRPNT